MLISIKNIDFNLEVDLPLSKSESNRLLMLLYYASRDLNVNNLSDSDDTLLLRKLLNRVQEQRNDCDELVELDCANAGTVLRFLMTALSMKKGRWLLTGSERMRKRPVDSLVDALRSLGVSIEYKDVPAYPPVMIRGGDITGGRVEVCVEQSSQFASSLLLAAPLWRDGLEMRLTGNMSSLPYIDMTIAMMSNCGIDVERNERTINVKSGNYTVESVDIESDWSAAAFWYELVAFSNTASVKLKGLRTNTLQADVAALKMFETLGVKTTSHDDGVVLGKSDVLKESKTFDFRNCPDLFPALIATCAGLQQDTKFTGLVNLSIKESDRKKAMIEELSKINISFEQLSDDEIKMTCPEQLPFFTEDNPLVFENYKDHRIAMALSLLSMKIGSVSMENTDVVSKSYPYFFESIGVKSFE